MWLKLQCRNKLITSNSSFEWDQNMNCCLFNCHVLIIPDSSDIAWNKGLRSRSSTEKPWDSGLYIVFAVWVWVYCSSPWQCASLNCNMQLPLTVCSYGIRMFKWFSCLKWHLLLYFFCCLTVTSAEVQVLSSAWLKRGTGLQGWEGTSGGL